MKYFGCLVTVFALLVCLPTEPYAWETELSIEGDRFQFNGEWFDMWGIRVASAAGTDEYTDRLIEALDDYIAYGVNAVTVFYMGSSGGHYDPFTADGTGWRHPEIRDRMDRIIEECDQRGMIVIAGIFYQWKNTELTDRSLQDWAAAREAVKTVASHLKSKGYTNVMLNIANEQNSSAYKGEPWERVRNTDDLIDLVEIAKKTHPELITGAGGYDHEKNQTLGLSPTLDVLLFDTIGPQDSGELSDRWLAAGINKPHVNVELFGGWTARFKPCGDFRTVPGIEEYFNEVDRAASRPALSVFFHSNNWCQGPSGGCEVRFDLAGQGSHDDRGIHWYFDYVESVRNKNQ